MLRKFVHTLVVPGTLTGAIQYACTIPSACTLQHVSMVQSNADGAGRVKLGLSTDDDIFSVYTTMGVSGVPVVFEKPDDFRNDVNPHLDAGDIFKLYCDFDGAGGTAAQDVTIVLTFTEG